MRSFKFFIVFSFAALLLVTGCERKVTEIGGDVNVIATDAAYIGTDACQACHADIHASFVKTGHPFKINDAAEAFTPGYYPFTTLPSSSPELNLSQAAMVIGGFRWKARFIDSSGFIMTGDQVQYNFETDEWVAYNSGKTKPYDCGPCHMTNYKDVGNQDDLEGLVGSWEFNGIQCEECHGPGELHAGDPYEVAMKIDRSNEACGKCHRRGDPKEGIPAKGGFVKHREQWNEMFQSKHASIQCVDCHNVHESLHPLNPNKDNAINIDCESCHLKETQSYAASGINHGGATCIDCHMPKAAKSAVAVGPYEADIRSHMFAINTAADAEMFTEDGLFAIGDLTLEFTCLQADCHGESTKSWGNKTKSWASTNAGRVHGGEISGGDDCFTCHGDADFGLVMVAVQEQYDFSVHGSSSNTDRNRLSKSYYQSCEKCHTSEGFIAEATGIPATGENFSAIGCFTCHAPHSDGNFGVRVTSAVTLGDGTEFDRGMANLCVSCHQSRRDVNVYVAADTTGSFTIPGYFGPHYGNQGDMLIGANAYEYAGYVYSNSAHVNVTGNGCVDCHMSPGQHASIGGHSWNMHNDDTGYELTSGCNVSTCHNGAVSNLDFTAQGDFDWNGSTDGIQTEVQGLLDSLHVHLEAAGFVDVDGNSISGVVIPSVDSAGALYNYIYVEDDRSLGVHNTDYVVGLLQSSINFLDTGDPSGTPANNTDMLSSHK